MATGTSLFMIALGAILMLAVDFQLSGIDIQTVGGILIAVGGVGLGISLFVLAGGAGSHIDAQINAERDRRLRDTIEHI